MLIREITNRNPRAIREVRLSSLRFPKMTKLSGSNFTEMTAQGDTRNVAQQVSIITLIIINGITCPFTVVLNALVIMAVKQRR